MDLPDVVPYAIPGFIALMLLEVFLRGRGWRLRYEARDTAASLTMGVGSVVVGAVAGTAIVVGLYFLAAKYALFDLGFTPTGFVVGFLLEDLAYYAFHRTAHECRFYWASHVVHHSSRYYNLSTALRQPWTGQLTLSSIFWLPAIFLGVRPEIILFWSSVSLVYQFWIHTEAIDRLGPLEWIFNTPSHHRVHHAANPRYLDANYAGVLIIWDRLFGSFIAEDPDDPPRYGLVKNIDSFHPGWIVSHEWVGIGRDLMGARSWRDVLGHLFGPPGWTRDGSRYTTAMIKRAWRDAGAPNAVVFDRGRIVPAGELSLEG